MTENPPISKQSFFWTELLSFPSPPDSEWMNINTDTNRQQRPSGASAHRQTVRARDSKIVNGPPIQLASASALISPVTSSLKPDIIIKERDKTYFCEGKKTRKKKIPHKTIPVSPWIRQDTA